MKHKGDDITGWIALDKPTGLTSTRALSIAKRLFNAKKAGHAGTLDPLASGVLPIAFGKATKTIPYVMDGVKEYAFSVRFGAETDTDDSEGAVTKTSGKRPSRKEIIGILPKFMGNIRQIPPQYSALKIDGKRAYDIARSGEKAEIKPRIVTVEDLKLTAFEDSGDEASFFVRCSKGTYVRSLARDIGGNLGCFGHVSFLRRLRSGPFAEKDIISLEKLKELVHSAFEFGPLLPLETVLGDIPALALEEEETNRFLNGQTIAVRGEFPNGTFQIRFKGDLVALGEVSEGKLKSKTVFKIQSS